MITTTQLSRRHVALGLGVVSCWPLQALAQASPFLTGANSLVTNLQAWLTPVAVLLLIGAAFFAMANRISWAWPLSIMAGIVIGFGAPQLVGWVRGMFAV